MKNKNIIDCNLSIKTVDQDGVFYGYAIVFGVIDSYGDIIQKGAISKNKNNFKKNIKLLWQHDHTKPIGIINKIEENEYGLYVKGSLITKIKKGYEAYTMLKQNAINGLSIGYTPISHIIDQKTGTRILTEIELWEISLVTFPANNLAKVTYVKNSPITTTINLLTKANKKIQSMKKYKSSFGKKT